MKGEIGDNHYCSAGYSQAGDCNGVCKSGRKIAYSPSASKKDCAVLRCRNYRRKHPTPEQFEQEYGFKWPDDGAVYVYIILPKGHPYWDYMSYSDAQFLSTRDDVEELLVICACTPFSKPPDTGGRE